MEPNPQDLGLDDNTAPLDKELRQISALATRQLQLEDKIAKKEAELKALSEECQIISERDLPLAMAACGLDSFTLAGSGAKIGIKLNYRCGQLDDAVDEKARNGKERRPLEDRLRAFEWLDKNGHGDLAKQVITIAFDRDQTALAEEVEAFVRRLSNKLRFTRARTVVWNTLSSFCREQDRQLEEPPLELLGVVKIRAATITRPKAP